jgi:8-oxo-dGTP diphosphatase
MAYTYKYPRPSVTADCIVITKEAEPKVLMIERGDEPFKGCWAFPGGFMNMDETTEQCAIRELEEETGLHISEVHQIGAYSKVDRDPRGRTVTVAYLAIVDEPITVNGQDDAAKAQWFPLSALPELAFDHDEIMRDAIRKYKEVRETAVQPPRSNFKEQKERLHQLSEQMREQCAHVQALCRDYKEKNHLKES